MSRFFSILLSATLLMAFVPEAFADTSVDNQVLQVNSSTAVSTAKSTPSAKQKKLLRVGAKIYITKLKGHSAKYQKKVYKKLTAYQRKAVRTFVSQFGQQRASASGTNAFCPKNRMCPLTVTNSSVRRFSVNAVSGETCYEWTLSVSEGGPTFIAFFPPFYVTWFRFQLINKFCSDGTKITSFYAEPSNAETMILFWDYKGYNEVKQDPLLGGYSIDYFVQASYEMSPPPIKGIVVVVHSHPWIRIHVHADGTGTYEEGFTS